MRVIIAGAGAIGHQVLRDLARDRDNEIVVVDTDEDRCEELSEEFDALVVHGDASDPAILEQAQVGEADALVVTTGSDAINTVIATLGHLHEVGTIVVKIRTNALRAALEEVDVSAIVAPTMAAAARIHAALYGSERTDLSLLVQGGLRLTELRVGRDGEGTTVGELDVPDGAVLVAVVHGDDARVARADVELAEGDLLLALVETDDALERVNRLLG